MNKLYFFVIAVTFPFYIQNRYSLLRKIKDYKFKLQENRFIKRVIEENKIEKSDFTKERQFKLKDPLHNQNEIIVNIFLHRKIRKNSFKEFLKNIFLRNVSKNKILISELRIPTKDISVKSVFKKEIERNKKCLLFDKLKAKRYINYGKKICK